MTYEDASNQLRDLIEDCRSFMDNAVNAVDAENANLYRRDIDALLIGISAIKQVEKVNTAHWDINCDGFYPFCSNCKKTPRAHDLTRYCPYCGAKMITRERENDDDNT